MGQTAPCLKFCLICLTILKKEIKFLQISVFGQDSCTNEEFVKGFREFHFLFAPIKSKHAVAATRSVL